ncbi:MAG: hypothetical protein C0615_07050 [Desulfuromonas sp.]|nr:MAG: hypothetical protein C0615_07050 [Desulfuromonas sp.]
MKMYIAMALFAFTVSAISLLRIMSEREFYRLTSMKRAWGRTRGLALHFLSNVALPLVVGVVFLGGGISGLALVRPLIAEEPFQVEENSATDAEKSESLPALADIYTSMA